jgi:hypothetical protein
MLVLLARRPLRSASRPGTIVFERDFRSAL